jgi:hypothetical protein
MTQIWKAKFFLGTLITTIVVTLSYEIKIATLIIPPLFLVIVSFVISTYLASLIIDLALNWKFGRKVIMAKTWIEGYWFLTTAHNDKPNAISQAGIVYISYEGDSYVLSVITYRKKTDDMHTGLSSLSEIAIVRSFDLKFSNVFTISNGFIETKGVTTGKFFCDGSGVHPNRFEGHVVLFNEGINRRQSGTKLKEKEIRKIMKEKGEDWKDEFLDKRTTASNMGLAQA